MGERFSLILWEGTPVGRRLIESVDRAIKNDSIYCLSFHVKRARIIDESDAVLLAGAWAHVGLFDSSRNGFVFIDGFKRQLTR
jgi:alkylhydroperoxidase family enzyme